jgi:hypothetical protein
VICRADAGKLQEPWRADGTGGKDDLGRGADHAFRRLDPDGAAILDHDPQDLRAGRTVRFGRDRAGFRKAVAVEDRRYQRWVSW